MRKNYILPILFIFICLRINAQSSCWYWSRIECHITNKNDSSFLIGVENKLRKTALEDAKNNKPGPSIMGGTFPESYPYQLSGDNIRSQLGGTQISPFTNVFMMRIVWNSSLDSCYVISFSPTIHDSIVINQTELDYHKWKFQPAYVTPFFTPLSEYSRFLNGDDLSRLRSIVNVEFIKAMNGVTSPGSLFVDDVDVSADSANPLPQADIAVLLNRIAGTIDAGKLKCYKTPLLDDPYSTTEINKVLVQWDSTMMLEDPNHPGTFISAPMKTEFQPNLLTFHNTWNGFDRTALELPNYTYVPFLSYNGKLGYISLYYPGIKTSVYIAPIDFFPAIIASHLEATAYKESFKAVFFRKMNIKAW